MLRGSINNNVMKSRYTLIDNETNITHNYSNFELTISYFVVFIFGILLGSIIM